jgi:CRP/FNR family transcriptional regulator, cyclic AMP receptor protein
MGVPAQTQKSASTQLSQPPLQAVPTGPQIRRLKKGELLFAEGENSRAMYLLKGGMIRLYKRKGDAHIELDTVHSGQVLGELAFLDGNPRSASGEALTDCELIEISGPTFQQVLVKLPDWLKILMKTIVGRLRTASTRIRQLESSSTSYDFDKDGKRSAHYVYISSTDALKICTALLLVGARNSPVIDGVVDVRVGLLQRYANQVMGVPVAKITSMLDILSQAGVTKFGEGEHAGKIFLRDIDFLEQLIGYMNEENLLEPSKRHDLSPRGFLTMSTLCRHLSRYPADKGTGLTAINVAEIKTLETTATGKEPFRMEEFQELVKLAYASNLNVKSATEVLAYVKADSFSLATRFQRVILGISAGNEQKTKGSR